VYDVPLNAPSSIVFVDVSDTNISGVIDVVDKIGPTGPTGAEGPVGEPNYIAYTPVAGGITGTPSVFGSYVKYGQDVTVGIRILYSSSSFGASQLTVTLPQLPQAVQAVQLRGVLDIAGSQGGAMYDVIAFTTEGSATARLYYPGANGVLTAITGTAPTTLTTATSLYLTGSYISLT
jgi:hypothetical protein